MSELKPFVTVIMPIRNEADFIARSLGAVATQDYPADRMEILVADGMSTDDTRRIVEDTARSAKFPIVIIDNHGKIVPTGWNAALKAAKGEIIVRVDGHTIIAPNYVSACVAALERTGADNVGGRMDAVGESDWAKAIALATSSPFGVGGARFHYATGEEYVDTVYMGAWRRETFDKIGGFDEQMVRNQDDEFNYRLRAAGGKILLSDTIQSTYYNRASLSKLWKQYYQYGYYKVLVLQKHPRQMSPRQFIPPLFVAGLVVGLVLAFVHPFFAAVYGAVIALYVLGNLYASWRVALTPRPPLPPTAREGENQAARLPSPDEMGRGAGGEGSMVLRVALTFLTLHLAYGAGFWMGVARFGLKFGGT